MPFFLIIAEDCPGATKMRIANRQDHVEYWMAQPGVVKVAGAMLAAEDAIGSVLLVEAGSEADAIGMVEGDPFTRCGVFSGSPRIIALRPAIGDWMPTA